MLVRIQHVPWDVNRGPGSIKEEWSKSTWGRPEKCLREGDAELGFRRPGQAFVQWKRGRFQGPSPTIWSLYFLCQRPVLGTRVQYNLLSLLKSHQTMLWLKDPGISSESQEEDFGLGADPRKGFLPGRLDCKVPCLGGAGSISPVPNLPVLFSGEQLEAFEKSGVFTNMIILDDQKSLLPFLPHPLWLTSLC